MNLSKIFSFTKKKNKSKNTKSKNTKSKAKKNNNISNKKCNKLSLNNAIGFPAPKVQLKIRVRDNNVEGDNKFRWDKLNTKDIYEGKRIIIFALPGAYTPTCHNTHLPGYEKNYFKIKKLGIDEIYCLSVNDAFVMFNWCKKLKAKNVKPIPDGNGKFTKAMGALVKKSNLGFGDRSWRYSMVVNNGRIEKMFCEKGKRNNCENDPFEVSDAETMMKYLQKKR